MNYNMNRISSSSHNKKGNMNCTSLRFYKKHTWAELKRLWTNCLHRRMASLYQKSGRTGSKCTGIDLSLYHSTANRNPRYSIDLLSG